MKKGFTLIEILIVIGLIAILAAIVIVAINPARHFAQARNAQRWSNVNTILNAIHQYGADNTGTLPSAIPTASGCTVTSTPICVTGAASCVGAVDLSVLTSSETYLVEIPNDPSDATATSTGYAAVVSSNGRVTVCAPSQELSETITVKR